MKKLFYTHVIKNYKKFRAAHGSNIMENYVIFLSNIVHVNNSFTRKKKSTFLMKLRKVTFYTEALLSITKLL